MTFKTSSDKIVRNKTAGALMILILLPLFKLFQSSDRSIWYLVIFLHFMLLLLFTYLSKPTQYKVDKDKLVICRPIGNVKINIQDIARVDRIHHDVLKNTIKGGAFGYLGRHDTDLGRIKFYATRRDNLIMLTKQDNKKIMLTPDNPEDFLETIDKLIKS